MVDYEKGTASWDLGQILTRHGTGTHGFPLCARANNVQSTAMRGIPRDERLAQALATECTCGSGDSLAEQTSLIKERKDDEPDGNADGS